MKKIFTLIALCLLIASCSPVASDISATGKASTHTQASTGTPPATSVSPAPGAGTTAPASLGKVPNFDHIILMVFENRNFKDVIGSQNMPFLNSLVSQNVLLTNYYALRHPSLPNYIGLISGSTQGITSDCTDCFVDKPNLADLIENSGRTWKDYQENMPSPCYVGNADPYAQKHNPFIYFNSIRLNAERCQRSVVPLTSLDADLAANQLPNFAFIMPNMCNSGHDCPAETADAWLKAMVTKLQASPALGKNSLIVVTFDEAGTSDKSTCCGLSGTGGGKIATLLVSPLLAQPGAQDNAVYSHYSLLKTFMAAWGLPDLENTALPGIQPIVNPFNSQASTGGSLPAPAGGTADQAPAAPLGACVTSAPASGKYNLDLCLSGPASGTTLSGDVTITAILKVTDTASSQSRAAVQRVVFYLDGNYLISDFQNPFEFTLPTARWVDGNHTLTVEAQMRDAFVSPQAGLSFDFKNGVTAAPSGVTGQFQPSTGTTPAAGTPFIVAAAGDAAGGETNAKKVSDLIASFNPNLFLYLGDVYERGSPLEYLNYYGGDNGVFGRFKSITDPTVGNHEYLTDGAAGYFNFWNNIPNYYSFDVTVPGGAPGGWHFISLNSNTQKLPPGPDSAQYQWLAADLAAHAGACTVVYYHHPFFNIGPEGATTDLEPVWKLLAQSGVSMVLNGHDHDYQRWQPLDGAGQPKPTGVTEFVVGGGGHGVQNFKNSDNRVAYALDSNPQAFGTLLLQLNPDGATFSYHSLDGSIPDSGVIPCVGRGPDLQAPGTPVGLALTSATAGKVDLSWTASSDNTGVAGYIVYRDGNPIAKLTSASLTYSDSSVQPKTSYAYYVVAVDLAGNHSAASAPVQVATPDVAPSQSFLPEADTYVTVESPNFNYGTAPVLRVDSAPDVRSYLRFNVTGLGGRPVARALLKIYANSASNRGISLFSVPENNWDENQLNYDNTPQIGSQLAVSPAFKAGDWITLDVSAYVTGEGQYSFSIGTLGSTSISLASRESGANSPTLMIDLR